MVNPDDFLNNLVAINIVRLRTERGWTQIDLADRLKVTFQHISQLETGRRGIGKRTLAKLAKAFQVDEGEFVKMPADLGTKEIRELWAKFYQVSQGAKGDLLARITAILELAAKDGIPPEAIKTLEAQIDLIDKLLTQKDDMK